MTTNRKTTNNKKGANEEGPQDKQSPKEIWKRFSPLRKVRAEALLGLAQDPHHKDGVTISKALSHVLFPKGWNWQSINTAANDLARLGQVSIEHGEAWGSFKVVVTSAPQKGGKGRK
jgi:hypothetical protein